MVIDVAALQSAVVSTFGQVDEALDSLEAAQQDLAAFSGALRGDVDNLLVRVSALEAGSPPPPSGGAPTASNANCYPATGLVNNVLSPATMAELAQEVNAAAAGTHILIPAGTYDGGTLTFTASNGTQANPIVVRPQGARGSVTINSPNWTLAAGSQRLVFKDLFFDNPSIVVNGSNHRITRCRFRQVARQCIVLNAATDARIDHCDVSDYVTNAANKRFISLNAANNADGSCARCLMDYNYVHDVSFPGVSAEDTFAWVIHNGGSNTQWNVNPGHIIDHTLVRNFFGQSEFINIKCSGYKVRFCTFENCGGYLQQRKGAGWEIRSCWLENLGGAFKCWDQFNANHAAQLVIGNRLTGSNAIMWIGASNNPAGGDLDTGSDGFYSRSRSGRFIGNNVDGQILVGGMWSGVDNLNPALNNNLWNNTVAGVLRNSFDGGMISVNQSGTTFTQDNEAFTAAVKLAPADVGMAAPDPLCPSGPQS